MSKFLTIHKQHRYYVPTCCTYIAADVDPQRSWPVPQCGEPVWGVSSFCETHHNRVYRVGKPLLVKDLVAEVAQDDPEAEVESADDQLRELA